MPTTIGSLVVFIAFLTPGFLYLARLETRFPSRSYTALRETAMVVSTSLLFNGLVVGVFTVIRFLLPALTPDVGAIVRNARPYFLDHYASILLWSGSLFVASVGLAWLAAVPPQWSRTLIARVVAHVPQLWRAPLRQWSEKEPGNRIFFESAWGRAFSGHDRDHRVYLGLLLKDGTYLYGPLASFNPQLEENDERDLVLNRPIVIRVPTREEPEEYDADALVVSAGEIKTVSVHRIPTSLLPDTTLETPRDTLGI